MTSVPNTALVTDSNPRTIVGYSANINVAGINTRLQAFSVEASAGVAGLSVGRFSDDTGAGVLLFGKSRNTTIGSYTIVQNADTLGEIKFAGDNGSHFNSVAAVIRASVDDTPGASDMPGRIEFLTTPNGSVTPAVRLRITSDGGVGLVDGITAPATLAGYALLYVDVADGDLKIKYGDGTVKTIVADT